jgi:hypothetical protein
MAGVIDTLNASILSLMKELHTLSPEHSNILVTQLFREYSIRSDIDVYRKEIKTKRTRQEAAEYIHSLTSTGRISSPNGGILFETYEEYIRGWKHIDKNLHSGDSVDEKSGLHYEIKYCENESNAACFCNIKPEDNIDFFIFGYFNTMTNTFTYYRDIPMTAVREIVKHGGEHKRNTKGDRKIGNNYLIQVNGNSRATSLCRHNHDILKDYIF